MKSKSEQQWIVCIDFRRGWFEFKSPPLSEEKANEVVDSCRREGIMAYRKKWPE